MKQIIKFFALALILMCAGTATIQAQQAKNPQQQQRSREQFAEAQARNIASQLALDDATAQKFINTFTSCQREIWEQSPRNRKPGQMLSENETEQALKARFNRSQKILDIREKYYKQYSKFLTQKQIQRVYQLEKQSMKNLRDKYGMGVKGKRKARR